EVRRPPDRHVGAKWVKALRRGPTREVQVHRRVNPGYGAESLGEPSRRSSLEPGIDAAAEDIGVGVAPKCSDVLPHPVRSYEDIVVRPQDVFTARLPNGQIRCVRLAGRWLTEGTQGQSRDKLL